MHSPCDTCMAADRALTHLPARCCESIDCYPLPCHARLSDPGYDERFRGWILDKVRATDGSKLTFLRIVGLELAYMAWLVASIIVSPVHLAALSGTVCHHIKGVCRGRLHAGTRAVAASAGAMPWQPVDTHAICTRTQVMHVATLAYLNFSFVVQHDVWTIHRPHMLAVAAAIAMQQDRRAASADLVHAFRQRMYVMHRPGTAFQHYKRYMEDMYKAARRLMRTAGYVPYQGTQFSSCLESLPWWRAPEELLGHEAGRGNAEGWVAPGVRLNDQRGVSLPWPPPWRLLRLRQQQQP